MEEKEKVQENEKEKEKKREADDELIRAKQNLRMVEEQIDANKAKLKIIDNDTDKFNNLNKSINRCIELLAVSVKGPKVTEELNEMRDGNASGYRGVVSSFDEDRENAKKELNSLYDQKETILKKIEEENKKLAEKEKKKEEETTRNTGEPTRTVEEKFPSESEKFKFGE